MDRRLGGPQSQYGRGGEKKNSQPLPGLEPMIIHPVAQRYTDWSIPAPILWSTFLFSGGRTLSPASKLSYKARKLCKLSYSTNYFI
jgi:hypothetical protein